MRAWKGSLCVLSNVVIKQTNFYLSGLCSVLQQRGLVTAREKRQQLHMSVAGCEMKFKWKSAMLEKKCLHTRAPLIDQKKK